MSFPADMLFYASYDSTLAADYTDTGNLGPDGTRGSPTVNTSVKNCGAGSLRLDKTGSFGCYVDYQNQTAPGQQCTVAMYVYHDSNVQWCDLFDLWTTTTYYDILDTGLQNNGQGLRFNLYDGTSSFTLKAQLNIWTGITQDTWNHIEMYFDCDSGDIKAFVNGTLFGSTTFTPFSMGGGNKHDYTVGNTLKAVDPDFVYIDDVQMYNTVQHTANFSPACFVSGPSNKIYNNLASPFGSSFCRGFGR